MSLGLWDDYDAIKLKFTDIYTPDFLVSSCLALEHGQVRHRHLAVSPPPPLHHHDVSLLKLPYNFIQSSLSSSPRGEEDEEWEATALVYVPLCEIGHCPHFSVICFLFNKTHSRVESSWAVLSLSYTGSRREEEIERICWYYVMAYVLMHCRYISINISQRESSPSCTSSGIFKNTILATSLQSSVCHLVAHPP